MKTVQSIMQTFSGLIIRTSLFHLLNARKTQSKKLKLNRIFEIVRIIRVTLSSILKDVLL